MYAGYKNFKKVIQPKTADLYPRIP